MRSASRVTSVGATNSGNSVIANFSLWSRIARPLLNTFAPCDSARSSRYVEYTYSRSNGGSFRITTAPNDASGATSAAPSAYQASGSPVRRSGQWVASTTPDAARARSRWSMYASVWPRRSASTIIAYVESL